MKLRLLLNLSLLLVLPAAFAETADDIFHVGAVTYLSNNIPQALEVVTNGRALFPDDIKLKKLEELLKQQNQQQQQQQQQKDEQQKQDEKQDQQSKQDQKDQQKQRDEKQSQDKKDQQQKDQQKEQSKDGKQKDKPEDKKGEPSPPMQAHAMTPQEAKQLLDAQKGDEQVLQFRPQGEPKNQGKLLKDW